MGNCGDSCEKRQRRYMPVLLPKRSTAHSRKHAGIPSSTSGRKICTAKPESSPSDELEPPSLIAASVSSMLAGVGGGDGDTSVAAGGGGDGDGGGGGSPGGTGG